MSANDLEARLDKRMRELERAQLAYEQDDSYVTRVALQRAGEAWAAVAREAREAGMNPKLAWSE